MVLPGLGKDLPIDSVAATVGLRHLRLEEEAVALEANQGSLEGTQHRKRCGFLCSKARTLYFLHSSK